jgi:hypothetical protein
MMYNTTVLVLSMVLALSTQLNAQTEKEQRESISMILRSSNEAPELSESKRVVFPLEFDWRDYQRIETEITRILLELDSLLPQVAEGLEDAHYCTTIRGPSGSARNYTVGDVCQEALSSALTEAYYQHLKPESKLLYAKMRRPSFMKSKSELKRWLEDRREKKLWELQVEVAESSLDLLSSAAKTLELESNIEQKWKDAIRQEIAELRGKRHAIASRWLEGDAFHFYTSPEKARSNSAKP